MKIKNPNSFLKISTGVIALMILVFGTLVQEKNAEVFSSINASLNEASVVVENIEQTSQALADCKLGILSDIQSEKSIFAEINNMDAIIIGDTSIDTDAMNTLTAGISDGRIETKILESGKKYEFVVHDGQVNFWKCILDENQLFSSVSEASEVSDLGFFSETKTFRNQVEKFDYKIKEVEEVPNFLNFIKLPAGHKVLETTALNGGGETFFKLFEIELQSNFSYNDLRKNLRDRVGITNLRPAVFGSDSYYWMWGEKENMAASVFFAGDKVFGISYQTKYFKHIRRVVNALQRELDLMIKKLELVRKKDYRFRNIKLKEFEESDLDAQLVKNIEQLENAEAILSASLSGNILEATEPIEIPEDVEISETNLPIILNRF
jgi:hypothetical protein